MKKHIAGIMILAAFSAAAAHSQSDGGYQIDRSVIANGGGTTSSERYSLTGTIGQVTAGTTSWGVGAGLYGVSGGFWHPQFGPTAATVSLGGRALAADGRPIALARITLVNANGAARVAISNGFGYFRVDSVEAGQTYLLSATHRQFHFLTQAVVINDHVTALELTALP